MRSLGEESGPRLADIIWPRGTGLNGVEEEGEGMVGKRGKKPETVRGPTIEASRGGLSDFTRLG